MTKVCHPLPGSPREPVLSRLPWWTWVAADVVLGSLMAVQTLPLGEHASGAIQPSAVAYGLALAVTLPVGVRRLWPIPVFAALLAASVVAVMLWRTIPYSGLPLALGAYTAATTLPSSRIVVSALSGTLGVSLAAAIVGLTVPALETAGARLFTTGVVVAGSVVLGVATGHRRRYAEQLRDQTARTAATEERLRIARELHDVVAHQMSVVTVQAGVARYVLDTHPAEAARSLASIEEASRAGLGELRQLVSALRDDSGSQDQHMTPTLSPAPGLADLDSLVARAGQAGVPVSVQVSGWPRTVPSGLDLSAYRIVQEALTNVVKHAGPARATVLLDYRPDALVIEVTDDGRGMPAEATALDGHHGLVGMRERVAIHRGHLDLAPATPSAGGVRIRAVLPLRGESA